MVIPQYRTWRNIKICSHVIKRMSKSLFVSSYFLINIFLDQHTMPQGKAGLIVSLLLKVYSTLCNFNLWNSKFFKKQEDYGWYYIRIYLMYYVDLVIVFPTLIWPLDCCSLIVCFCVLTSVVFFFLPLLLIFLFLYFSFYISVHVAIIALITMLCI